MRDDTATATTTMMNSTQGHRRRERGGAAVPEAPARYGTVCGGPSDHPWGAPAAGPDGAVDT
jgi:hypothetical protein